MDKPIKQDDSMIEIKSYLNNAKCPQEKWDKIFHKDITLVCQDCGNKNNWKQFEISTWYPGECSICGETKQVTEFRDFFYGRYKK